MTYRSELRKFIDHHFGGPGNMAKALGLTTAAIKRWDETPELMLKYLLQITDVTKCTVMDVVEAVESQKKSNDGQK
jgi:hypothetical protein